MSYEQALKYLYDLQPIGIKLGLHNTLSLLSYFHNPHRQIKTIHVAGTNGKGSTCAMIRSILQTAGYQVGLYTSPHLVDFTERISINGLPISKPEVVRLTKKIQQAIRDGDFQAAHPTFFEVVTVMALTYFYQQGVDLAILEVGMGGRLDATNVIQPLLGIITNIDLDHQQYLGESFLDIAREKAGIIKEGLSVVTGAQQPQVLHLLDNICRQRRAVLLPAPPVSIARLLTQDLSGQSFEIAWPDDSPRQRFFLPLLGEHQIQNALVALSAIRVLNQQLPREISNAMIVEGLASVQWPGRIEVYPGSPTVIIDGAHNPAGAHQLSLLLKGLNFSRLVLILGIMKDKQISKICQELIPLADQLVLTRPEIARACPPCEIMKHLPMNLERVKVTENIPEAIALARSIAASDDLICITGSLYTVGEAKVVLNES